MAAGVTFLQHLELRRSTGAPAGLPVSSTPAASCSLRLGPATADPMSCRPDAAAYWKTSGTTASQTSNSVTCQDTWWSSLKTSMDPGGLKMLLYSGILILNLNTRGALLISLFSISTLCSNLVCLDLSSRS